MTQRDKPEYELPARLIVFSTDGRAQFGWRNPETGELFAEADGGVITNALGTVEWHAGKSH